MERRAERRAAGRWEAANRGLMTATGRRKFQQTLARGTAHDKLVTVFSMDGVRHLSEREARRRLYLAMRAVVRVQKAVRLWLLESRNRIESYYKVTTRSQYVYSSNSPPNPEEEQSRVKRREECGWRAPLTKRYLPLGDPALSLDRKPAWAVSGVEDEQVTQNEQHVFVGHGESVRGQVPKFGCAYFQTYMYDSKAQLTVTVEALSGDPDLFMSRNNQYPDQIHHTWSSVGVGTDALEVSPADPSFGLGQYYIAVYGGGAGMQSECSFVIHVSTKRQVRANQQKDRRHGTVGGNSAAAMRTAQAVQSLTSMAPRRDERLRPASRPPSAGGLVGARRAEEQAARLRYVSSEFELMRSERNRDLTSDLDTLASSRLEVFQSKYRQLQRAIDRPGSVPELKFKCDARRGRGLKSGPGAHQHQLSASHLSTQW